MNSFLVVCFKTDIELGDIPDKMILKECADDLDEFLENRAYKSLDENAMLLTTRENVASFMNSENGTKYFMGVFKSINQVPISWRFKPANWSNIEI